MPLALFCGHICTRLHLVHVSEEFYLLSPQLIAKYLAVLQDCVQQCPKGTRVEPKTRSCQACDGVTNYSDAPMSTQCNPISACKEGAEFLSRKATPSSDRVCKLVHECVGGEFLQAAPTATTDRVCAVCSEADDGTNPECKVPLECEPGYQLNLSRYHSCMTLCAVICLIPLGSSLHACCSATSKHLIDAVAAAFLDRRVCVGCVQGQTFQPAANQTMCQPATTCQPGQRVATAPTPSADRVCGSCVDGQTYSAASNAAKCDAVAPTCPDGQQEVCACLTVCPCATGTIHLCHRCLL